MAQVEAGRNGLTALAAAMEAEMPLLMGRLWTVERKRDLIASLIRHRSLKTVAARDGVPYANMSKVVENDPGLSRIVTLLRQRFDAELRGRRIEAYAAETTRRSAERSSARPLERDSAAGPAGAGGPEQGARAGTRSPARPASNADKPAILSLLAARGGFKTVADELGLEIGSLFALRDSDPAFAAAWRRTVLNCVETVESEILALAMAPGGSGARAAELRTFSAAAAQLKASILAADLTGDATPAMEINLDAARMELEQRMCALVERFGDPFGDDPARPLNLPARVVAP